MALKIAIVDYGVCNLHSVYKKITGFNAQAVITADPREIDGSDKIMLPGIGHFGAAVQNIGQLGLSDCLNENIQVKKKPVLGICLGMQLMAKSSEEAPGVAGFGWIDAKVTRFSIDDKLRYKIPHIGWNKVTSKKKSHLLAGIPDQSEFYFTHSYHYGSTPATDILGTSTYEYDFVAAVEQDNIFGVQFHPEKSHQYGGLLLSNFLKL